jgi:hypothetical protein
MSIKETRKAAFVGSIALAAHHIALVAPGICQPEVLPHWEAYRQYAELEGFQKNPLLKLDDIDPASVPQAAQYKLKHNISKTENTRLSRDLIEMIQLPVPGSGVTCSTDDLNQMHCCRHLMDITKPCPGCGRSDLFHCDKRSSAPLRSHRLPTRWLQRCARRVWQSRRVSPT